jgi:hypothetical protein
MNDNFIILKLVSGEQVMAILANEDENFIELNNPMIIRMIPFIEKGHAHEHVTAVPLCQFADNGNFKILKRNIMFVKKLHKVLIPHYNRIVGEHEESVLVRHDHEGNYSEVQEIEREEMETITIDEINKRIELLEAIIDAPVVERKEDTKIDRYFIEGNKTKH